MPLAHCPHCLLPMPGATPLPHPPAAIRCPHCRLIIGAGRARAEAAEEDGNARSRSSAAGVLANAARRARSAPGSVEEIVAALRGSAEAVGCPVERLRMLDYQHEAESDAELPDLAAILATYSTWKSARAAAAADRPVVAMSDDAAQFA